MLVCFANLSLDSNYLLSLQLSASGNFSGQPQPGTVGDFMGVASQHMQQASAPPPKWSNSTNQQAESKPMMGGPSQMQAANQMQAAHKMGGANNQMKQMNPQMQKVSSRSFEILPSCVMHKYIYMLEAGSFMYAIVFNSIFAVR